MTQDITYILYPTGMLISCIFLLLTLFVYIVDPELHRPLFGKITIGFVLNNLAAFLCLAVVYLGKRSNWLVRGTSGCILIGYFSLYTFTSFMMWINAMAANIFFKFSRVMTGAGAPDNSLKRFSLYAIYAQVWFYIQCMDDAWLPGSSSAIVLARLPGRSPSSLLSHKVNLKN